jgi:hypothetical protein
MTPEHDDEAFAEQLFEAARHERPRDAVKRRALGAPSLPSRAGRVRHWLLYAAALGALAVLVVSLRGAEPPARVISAENIAPAPKSVEAPVRRAPVAVVEPAPTVFTPSKALAPSVRSASPKPPPATLEEELAMVDRIRQALLDGNGAAALAGLAQYDKLATSRRLGAEATLLRIQTLGATGRSAEASRLASEFVAQNPNSPLVDRAKGYIREPESEKQPGVVP